MDSKNVVIALCIVISSLIYQGYCLECYDCNSVDEPGCGSTWTVSKDDALQYLKKCEGEMAACKKIMTSDTHKGGTIVTRSCYNSTTEMKSDDYICHDLAKKGESCYCTKDMDDGKPCNGRQPLLASWELLSALVLLICLTHLRH